MKFNYTISAKPRKQRKLAYNADCQEKRVMMSSNLSPELRKTHGIRSLPIRKGDEVRIMRGSDKGKSAVVKDVSRMTMKVKFQDIVRENAQKKSIPKSFDASNLQIIKLHTDNDRMALINRKLAGRANQMKD